MYKSTGSYGNIHKMATTAFPLGEMTTIETVMILSPLGQSLVGKNWVMMLHGYGADPSIASPASMTTYGPHAAALVAAGLVVVAPNDGGPAEYSGPLAHAALDSVYNVMVANGLAATCGIAAFSMGGCLALDWYRRNTAKVRAVMLGGPVTDLDYFYANGWNTILDNAFSGNYVANAPGHKPKNDYASYQGLGIPVHLYHGTADATVPYSHSQTFVGLVNDPNINLITLQGAPHVVGPYISPSKTVAHLCP